MTSNSGKSRFIFRVTYQNLSKKSENWEGEATRVETLCDEGGDPSLIMVFDGDIPVFILHATLFESGRVIKHLVKGGLPLAISKSPDV
jgi:hypothetical protein